MAKAKRYQLTLVILCVLWGPLAALPQEFGGGTGEPNDPYLIYTPEQLNEIGPHPETWHKHFKLMADIDLANYGNDSFNLIGCLPSSIPFSGVFDGNGHIISTFTYTSAEEKEGVALFELVEGADAEIKNLGLVDPNINVPRGLGVASLVGEVFTGGTVSNCFVRGGTVRGHRVVAGLVAGTRRAHILNCYAITNVVGDSLVGGLVGADNEDGIIIQCYAAGNVVGNEDTGGLLGANSGIVFQSFWDEEASGQPTSAGGEARTTAEMQAASTYAAWAYTAEEVWTIDDGNDYPRLAWESQTGQTIPTKTLSDWLAGQGTTDDPYLIRTPDELTLIGAFPRDWDKHFRLVTDVDMSLFAEAAVSPIGYYWDHVVNKPFTGVFDGGGHVIANATYNGEQNSSLASPLASQGNLGVFGYVDDPNARIAHLELVAPNVDAGNLDHVGSLVGRLARGTITNCSARDGHVSGRESVGGLVGTNLAGTIEGCYAGMTVQGSSNVGGLVGQNQHTIENSHAAGQIAGYFDIGGLVGFNADEGTCFACSSTATVSAEFMVGGLAGANRGTVESSFAAAIVSGGEEAGGLLGYNAGTVANSYALGVVSGDSLIGGLAGANSRRGPTGAAGIVLHCFSAARVAGDSNVGGLLAYSDKQVQHAFWDMEASGQTSSAGGTGKTTAQMQTAITFTDAAWDFDTIWMICEPNDYPRLQWQGIQCED